ncbi:hypothetical protein ABBQ32_012872 [Trebouxia sp. C0010 RCD-2024]
MTDSKKKQKIAADPSLVHAAQPGHSTATKLIDGSACNTNIENLYKFRNGKGDMLKTPKRSSIARALALLAPSPLPAVCDLTITGSNWPVAAVVTENGVESHLVQPEMDVSGTFTIGRAVKRQCTEE